MIETTISVSSAPAVAVDRPSPATKNGKPHSRLITVALNWVLKCIQKPRWVPGCAQDAARLDRTAVSDIGSPRRCRCSGLSRSTSSAAHPRTTPSDAATR